MTREEGERLIIAEMRTRLSEDARTGPLGGFVEYNVLKKERPDLFEWRSAGDQ